uniref:Cystinosin n=1 Tax=Rhodosorus marinus TaxID=101924 RepID=A0A7S3EDW9_9RHOD|mmetsp:Transcript_26080/g.102385  ORF Transcript_26080/g.102385 Transcript_26080/m.102385 type:complete len:241 (+) Transcript_26080:372-1094(+)
MAWVPWGFVSWAIGWLYFLSWSVSFYPQVVTNYRRRSVQGLSLDFVCYNLLGFSCYASFTIAAYPNSARLNDVFFSVHAFLLTSVTALQCCVYDRGEQKVSPLCKLVTGSVVSYALIFTLMKMSFASEFLSWKTLLLSLSFVKLAITAGKYIPQVLLNHSRRSTVGWNVWNVILDFTGGTLSMLQVVIDGFLREDWSSVLDNPVKFLLGFTSIGFDVVFLLQHYVLYRKNPERTPLSGSV